MWKLNKCQLSLAALQAVVYESLSVEAGLSRSPEDAGTGCAYVTTEASQRRDDSESNSPSNATVKCNSHDDHDSK